MKAERKMPQVSIKHLAGNVYRNNKKIRQNLLHTETKKMCFLFCGYQLCQASLINSADLVSLKLFFHPSPTSSEQPNLTQTHSGS